MSKAATNGSFPADGKKVTDREFVGVPDIGDLLPNGGAPGVEYCLIDSSELGQFERMIDDPDKGPWWLVPRTQTILIRAKDGPGVADSVLLVGRGTPIRGASPANGRRRYNVSDKVLRLVGLLPPIVSDEVRAITARMAEKARQETDGNKQNSSGAARSAIERAESFRT